MPGKTYVDTSVLFAAIMGKSEYSEKAVRVLDDPGPSILTSEAVRLEIFPKAIYQKRAAEQSALEELFTKSQTLPWDLHVSEEAYELACRCGTAAMDSIHLAFAAHAQADEFVTAEKSTKPLFRYNQPENKLRIRSLQDL